MTTPMEKPAPGPGAPEGQGVPPRPGPPAGSGMPPGAGSPEVPPESGAAGPYPYAVSAVRTGLGVAALVLGVVGLFLAIAPFLFWVGGILGVLALVLGVVGLVRAAPGAGRVSAIVGIALGALAILLSAAWLLVLVLFARASDAVGDPVREPEWASAAPEAPGAPEGTAPAELAFGETHAYEDGVRVTVSKPRPFTPDRFAAGYERGDTAVRVTITIVNGSGKAVDVSTALPEVRDADGAPVEAIFDGSGATGVFRGTVLPGKRAEAGYAFSVPADADGEVRLELAPQLLAYEPAIWSGPVK
ncbi:DUF4190 domain-containing protein [Streptomyces sp. TLI_105]|uniref:DUF4190 domain-containing protein n=1 Tax=Streptomyces sp. TLI_105 TaxID=1881019 RepID=UPI0008967B35|nr:DUF4190 domain-containing protein [Streptomyces sp. TLI_105]SED51517.1 protein of unknown function [Streptomyces sp. TLI_105]